MHVLVSCVVMREDQLARQLQNQYFTQVVRVNAVPSIDIEYHQILVNADLTGNDPQVTFDDNKDSNCWSYHRGGNYPNVSGDVMPHTVQLNTIQGNGDTHVIHPVNMQK